MASSVTLFPRSIFYSSSSFPESISLSTRPHRNILLLQFHLHRTYPRIQASRRISNFPQEVGFSVNGLIMLAFLWVLKAFLEVVCTLGSVVFVSILLIRGIWSGVSYLQDSRKYRVSEFDDERQAWNGAQPAS